MGKADTGYPKIFVDSNVVLNLLSADVARADRSEALMAKRPTISVQVLNDVANVCLYQLQMSWSEVGQFLDEVKALCQVAPLTVEAHDLARRIAERHELPFHDACIVATATIEGCQSLYIEGMHNIILEDSLTLRDPFA
ncbi:PIN domain-containing protein [Pseudomonas chlororaphis]|uniref:PIN domain-containing protein n=1 Tax=Pseudomonas chlororaphis TaxID=587753 RepID=UPI0005663631|nr:PIN domain-containing protein [Pseudomonas chlororaphis]